MNQEHDTQSPEETENSARPSFGAELRRVREQSGQTVDEIASALFVRPHLIAALETEDLSVFSAPVYAMGLLRSYSRLLEIRPEPLLAALESMEAGHDPVLTSISKEARSVAAANGRQFRAGLMVGAVVLIIAVVVGFYQSASEDAPMTPATSSEGAGAEAEPEAGLGPENVKATSDASDSTAPELGDDSKADAVNDSGNADVKADSGDQPSPSTDVAEPEANLLLTFETDSWAEVHDAGGRRLLTRVGRAGQKLSLQGQPPFDVRLGYAPGVRIEYNGQPYVWEQKKGSRVAHLQVGAVSNP